MLTIREILVPVDFNETSERAVEYAIDLASKFGAKVTLMHAYQIPVYGFPDGTYITGAEVAAQISNAAQKRLDTLFATYKVRGVAITPLLREGIPWEEINAVADEIGADLLIIGTHGRRGLTRALLGSVAENVIRTATRPVLTIHGPRDATLRGAARRDVARPSAHERVGRRTQGRGGRRPPPPQSTIVRGGYGPCSSAPRPPP